jgi:saccharopepsin
MSRDTLRVGRHFISSQDFAEATEENGPGAAFWEMDGVFGLGFVEAAVNSIMPPFYNMIQQGLVEPVFSFYFGDTHQDNDESEVVLGGVNHNQYVGNLIALPLRNKPTWETTLTAVSYGDWSVDMMDTGAAIDTGASFTLLPASVADQLQVPPSFL